MSATIEFYGLCLFVMEKGQIRVLLPMVGRGKPHYARFLDRHSSNKKSYQCWDLHCGVITISRPGADQGGRPVYQYLNELIDLRQLKPSMKLEISSVLDTRCTQIVLKGGELKLLRNAPYGKSAYRFGRHNKMESYTRHEPACAMIWQDVSADALVCTYKQNLDERTHDYITSPSDPRKLVIGNVCSSPDPLDWDCVRTNETGTVWDYDFDWYYNLFRMPQGKIGNQWQPVNDGPLPCIDTSKISKPGCASLFLPIMEAKSGTTSTCYNSQFCDPEEEDCP